jgi:hypothetical protein
MIVTRCDGLLRTEAFRGSRACFHRFDCAIARRRVGHKRIEQMVCGVSDIVDGTIKAASFAFEGFVKPLSLRTN